MRVIIVIQASLVGAANRAASQPDTDNGGAGNKTFTTGLSASGVAPITAYLCDWNMTPALVSALQARFRNEGATVAEVGFVPGNGNPASPRFALFDAAVWAPDQILTKLSLKIIPVPRTNAP